MALKSEFIELLPKLFTAINHQQGDAMKTSIVITSFSPGNTYGDVRDLVNYIYQKTQNYVLTKQILKEQYGITIKLKLHL